MAGYFVATAYNPVRLARFPLPQPWLDRLTDAQRTRNLRASVVLRPPSCNWLLHGAVKGTPYKWLDIAALCRLLLPGDAVNRIRYLTARVQPEVRDPDKPTRQQLYLRALATTPNLSLHFGHFLVSQPRMALANPQPGQSRTVEVIKTEEGVGRQFGDLNPQRKHPSVVLQRDANLFRDIRQGPVIRSAPLTLAGGPIADL